MKPLPQGCDQQGRYPEAAEAATEIGADDDAGYSAGYWLEEIVLGLALVAVIVFFGVVGGV